MKIFNTLSGIKDELVIKRNEREFTMYFCGPTVYNYAHIGNFRTYLLQDVLVRTLRICGYHTIVARNITDVDDKTIRNSMKSHTSLKNFTEKWTKVFHEDCEKLNILLPDFEPKATEHIAEQIDMIKILVDKNFAYVAKDGSVYFKVSAFKQYGALSKLASRELETQELDSGGKRNLADEYEREQVSDFALWKASKPEDGENFWESPWGNGRPGWHIECSAMAKKYLGETIDLHSGGVDLKFPHHENEIAQSECANGKQFARYWMHIAHLLVDGTKMSKSLGNLYTLQDIIDKGFSPESLRYTLIAAHYSQSLNFTLNNLVAAQNALDKLQKFAKKINYVEMSHAQNIAEWKFFKKAFDAITDDLNTPECLGHIFKTIHDVNIPKLSKQELQQLNNEFSELMFGLGLRLDVTDKIVEIPENIKLLAERRWTEKLNKNYKEADSLRQQLTALGWAIKDSSESYTIERI